MSLNKLKIISEELQRYKTEHGLVDFPDMIEKFLNSSDTPKLRVMFVDEAQDLMFNTMEVSKENRRIINRFFYCRR